MEDSHATQPYKHTDDADFSHEIQKEENEEAEQGPFSVPCNQYFEGGAPVQAAGARIVSTYCQPLF